MSDQGYAGIPVDYDPFASGTLVEEGPSTEPQREIWISAAVSDDASAAFNQSLDISLIGDLDVGALRVALSTLMMRHDALRSSFAADGLTFVVDQAPELPFIIEDLTGGEAEGVEARLARVADEEVSRPFDLLRGPLFRARLCRTGVLEHHLLLTLHHIVCDGWSTGILYRELAALYEANAAGRAVPLPQVPSFTEFARRLANEQKSDAHERARRYWMGRYETIPPSLELPRQQTRPSIRTYRAQRVDHALSETAVAGLRKVGASRKATLVTTLFGSFAAFLSRITGLDDLVIGLSAAGQPHYELEGLVGHTVNLLPVRMTISADRSFSGILDVARRELLDAQEHQTISFGELVRTLDLPRDPSRVPLVPVVFNLDRETPPVSFGPVEGTVRAVPRRYETFEWMVNVVESPRGVVLECSFNADIYDADAVRGLLDCYSTFLDGIVAEPTADIATLSLISPAQRTQIGDWNSTARTYPAHRSLHALVEEQVARTPKAVAVMFEDERLSYAELDAVANRLARRLVQLGVGPEVLVGVCLERSLDLVVALLAILKAGGAYVPLDPDYPPARLTGMVEDARPKLVLSQTDLRNRLPADVTVLCLDATGDEIDTQSSKPVDVEVTLDNAAYVIFTSGSTGRPKGAVNTHRAICNRLLWMQETFALGVNDRVLQKTPYSFDVSVWEFFWPLMTGATLVVAKPGGHREPEYLAQIIRDAGITTVHFVPSMLQAFLGANIEDCTSLRRIICSGEALGVDAVQTAHERLPTVEVHNLYGPTEAAVDVTWWPCPRDWAETTVPIGRPIANTQIHILDARGQPTPIGLPGELHIGGVQVGREYLRRPDLTAERFVADPFTGGGARMYRTGDLAYWRADGAVEFLGRLDHQVKVHGLRIELGEIEAALEALPEVRQAVVTVRGEGDDRRLVAYVVFVAGKTLPSEEIRNRLASQLPQYMVPGMIVPMDILPLTPSGKVDRKALPDPVLSAVAQAAKTFEPPEGPVEQALANVWRDLLEVERVGRHDNFFDLGGHSLLVMRMSARLSALGQNGDGARRFPTLPVHLVFEAPTVRALAERLEALRLLSEPNAPSEAASGADIVF